MSHRRVSTIPFAWENKPGISKVVSHQDDDHQHEEDNGRTDLRHFLAIKELPPPPVPSGKARVLAPELQIPLPPLAFHPPVRSSSKKGRLWKQNDDDPFMTAYKECTKKADNNKLFRSRKHKRMFSLSCVGSSCSVRDDSMVNISELPRSQSGSKDFVDS